MTRFQQELQGLHGDFWKKDAMKRVESAKEKFANDTFLTETGALCWKSNGNAVPEHCLEEMIAGGCDVNVRATLEHQKNQRNEFFKNYNPTYTAEDISEMKAAFGEGTVVVNVFTGKKIQL